MKKNNVLAMACALLLGVSSATSLCAGERGDWSMTVGADAVSGSESWLCGGRGHAWGCVSGASVSPSVKRGRWRP